MHWAIWGFLPAGFSLLLSTLLLTILGLSRFRNGQGLPVARWHCVTVTAQLTRDRTVISTETAFPSVFEKEVGRPTSQGSAGLRTYPYRYDPPRPRSSVASPRNSPKLSTCTEAIYRTQKADESSPPFRPVPWRSRKPRQIHVSGLSLYGEGATEREKGREKWPRQNDLTTFLSRPSVASRSEFLHPKRAGKTGCGILFVEPSSLSSSLFLPPRPPWDNFPVST